MKLGIFILTIAFALETLASGQLKQTQHNPEACKKLETAANTTLRNLNAAFGMNLQLEFISTPLVGSDSKKPGFISLSKPCHMPEKVLPSTETYLFVLAHEFAHKIIHKYDSTHCLDEFKKRNRSANKKFPKDLNFNAPEDSHHMNADILALKILDHLSVNQRDASAGLESFLSANSETTGFNSQVCCERTRLGIINNKIPTSFARGDDLVQSGYITDIPEIKHFLSHHYPHSTFVKDVAQKFPEQDNKCSYPTLKDQAQTSSWYTQLNREEFRTFREAGTDLVTD